MFSGAFSTVFAGVAPAYIAPMRAQQILTDGGAWKMLGSGLLVGGMWLIGWAGKTFEFSSPESAQKWVNNAKNIGIAERVLLSSIDQDAAERWKERKRQKLEVIGGRLIDAAARQSDTAKQAALLAESGYCFSKWAVE